MDAYLWIKYLHVACVILSLSGFAARGALMLAGSPLLNARWVRIVPHVVDTVLLASAVWLAWFLGQVPFVHGWITAKVFALVAYVILGSIALKYVHAPAVVTRPRLTMSQTSATSCACPRSTLASACAVRSK